jgi:transglutaminase-like putative cysteine protease
MPNLSRPCKRSSALSVPVEIFLLCISVASAFAASGNEPADTHFLTDTASLYQRVSQISPAAGADVLFLDDEETVVFDIDGRAIRSRYFLYKVLTQKGAQGWGDISSSWEPWHGERPKVRARVITADGTVHPLDEKTITDAPAKESAANVFSDRRVLRAPLPAVASGSLVEEELVSTESTPYFGAGTVERFYCGGSVTVQHTRLILDAPAALPLRYVIHLLPDLKPRRNESEGRTQIIFDYGPIDAVDDPETGLPSDTPAYPSITFSTGDSWRQVAERYGKIIDKQIAGAELNSIVDNLIRGKPSHNEKAAAIVQYLDREVRYTGVEFGEAALVPQSPSESLARKYGDCKDKASLLVAMLRTADIPAYIALLNAGSPEDVVSDLPGIGMFDHAIVYVPGNPDLWIDATDEYARLGEIPNGDQGRLALIVRADSNSLVHTPVSSSADNVLIEKREIYLAENGPARIVETSQPHGSSESSYRRSYADKQSKAAKDELTNYVKSQYLAEKLDRFDRTEPTDLSKQFELVLESDRAKRGITELNIAAAAIHVESLFSRLPVDLQQPEKEDDGKPDKDSGQKPKKKRTSDYQLPQAFVTEWHYSITPPAGFGPKPLPSNAQISLGPCTLTEEFAADKDGVVHAILRFDTVKRRLTGSEGSELRNRVAQLMAGEAIRIYFEPIGQTLFSQGKVREALGSYRELIALHPKEAVHHLQVAEVLLTAGLGEAARAEAQAAVKLEPTSALAEKTLAEILEYDLVGRKFRPGSDYAGAEAAFRSAERLDPDDKTTVGDLGLLLEHNRWGLRYGPGAKLKDAIAQYRKLTADQLTELGLQNNLPFALFYAGEFSEAQRNAETLNPQPVALIVACEAALNGSEAALAEARKRTGGEEQFKEVAAAAGKMLVNLREYSPGAALEETGASGTDASDTAAYVALYRKTVPRERLQFPDDPAGVALRFELLATDPDLTLDQLRSICSRNGAKVLAIPKMRDTLVEDTRGRLSRKARKDYFDDVGLDLSFTRAQPRVQGNDATGYKVTLWPSATYKSVRYIVKEDGHYKVLGIFPWDEGAGLEVLDRIADNDVGGARVLLDWLREDWPLKQNDDPLSGDPFSRIWTKGQDADAAYMKIAAAATLVFREATAPIGISILEAAVGSVASDTGKVNIILASIRGYDTLDDYEKGLSVRAALAAQYPQSESIFVRQTYNLRALRRFEEADNIAQNRLQGIPGDLAAMRALAYNAEYRGDYVRAVGLWKKIIETGQAEPLDLNDASWYALFTGKVEAADLENALRATQLSNNKGDYLHTLGCLYAEAGKTKEAREILVQAMDELNLDEPDDNYWYAFGRMAEQYGERDVAMADFTRLTEPKRRVEIPVSSYQLAQIRLRALRGEKQ